MMHQPKPTIDNNAFELRMERKLKSNKRKHKSCGLANPALDVAMNDNLIYNNIMEVKTQPAKKVEEHIKGLANPCLDMGGTDLEDICSKTKRKQNKDDNFTEMEYKSLSAINDEKKLLSKLKKTYLESEPIALKVQDNNTYEVARPSKHTKKRKQTQKEEFVFSNPALDVHFSKPTLKTIDEDFEVVRKNKIKTKETGCFENPALELPNVAIALPFTPSVHVRVNFQDRMVENLASNVALSVPEIQDNSVRCVEGGVKPSKIRHLLETLEPIPEIPESENADIEQSIDMDEEIDMYQNEVENSINEAKTEIMECEKDNKATNIFNDRLRMVKSGGVNNLRSSFRKNLVKSIAKQLLKQKSRTHT